MLIGKHFKGTPKPIKEIIQDAGTVIVEGVVCRLETKELRSERYSLLLSVFVTDYEDTIECRFFLDKASRGRVENSIGTGDRIRVRGKPSIINTLGK